VLVTGWGWGELPTCLVAECSCMLLGSHQCFLGSVRPILFCRRCCQVWQVASLCVSCSFFLLSSARCQELLDLLHWVEITEVQAFNLSVCGQAIRPLWLPCPGITAWGLIGLWIWSDTCPQSTVDSVAQ
jgi:hypothetical protein